MLRELRYSPDQPRDEHGRFGEGSGEGSGEKQTYYHGTTTDAALTIWKEGLTPGVNDAVYVTQDKGWAHNYGQGVANSKGQEGYAIVTLSHDASDFKADPEHEEDDKAAMSDKSIPKESVKSIEWYDKNSNLVKKAERALQLRYSPDQPRDEHGRFGEGSGDTAVADPNGLEPGQTTEDAHRDPETKQWDEERGVLHAQIVEDAIGDRTAPTDRAPIATILGGGTASGKTTLSRDIIEKDPNVLRIDPDIARLSIPEYAGLKESDPQNAAGRVHEEASAVTKQITATAIAGKLDFTYDSTTANANGAALATGLIAQGYKVDAVFIDVPVSVAMDRAATRAEKSTDPANNGRIVPEGVIRSSHTGAAKNFFALKDTPGLNSLRLYDNRGTSPKLVYEKSNGKETIHDAARFAQYQNKANGKAE